MVLLYQIGVDFARKICYDFQTTKKNKYSNQLYLKENNSAISCIDSFVYLGAQFACTLRQTREPICRQIVENFLSNYGSIVPNRGRFGQKDLGKICFRFFFDYPKLSYRVMGGISKKQPFARICSKSPLKEPEDRMPKEFFFYYTPPFSLLIAKDVWTVMKSHSSV